MKTRRNIYCSHQQQRCFSLHAVKNIAFFFRTVSGKALGRIKVQQYWNISLVSKRSKKEHVPHTFLRGISVKFTVSKHTIKPRIIIWNRWTIRGSALYVATAGFIGNLLIYLCMWKRFDKVHSFSCLCFYYIRIRMGEHVFFHASTSSALFDCSKYLPIESLTKENSRRRTNVAFSWRTFVFVNLTKREFNRNSVYW